MKKIFGLLFFLFFAFLPCFSAFAAESSTEASELRLSDMKSVGKQEEGGQAICVYNQADKKITKIQMKKPKKKKWSKNILRKSERIEKEEKVLLYLPEKFSEQKCDIRITFGKGKGKVIHKLKLQDTGSVTIYQTKKYAYVEYVSLEEKDIVSTRKAEKAIWEEEERKRREEEERRRREEEARRRAIEEAEAAARAAEERETSRRSSGGGSGGGNSRREEGCADSGGGHYEDDGDGGWTWVPD